MADLTITISNTLSVMGPGPASLYGTAQFGVDVWGSQTDLTVQFEKNLASETVTLSDGYSVSLAKYIQNTLSVSSSIDLVSLLSSNGYYHVLAGGVTDPTDRYFPTYTSDTASTSYSSATAASTTWSAA